MLKAVEFGLLAVSLLAEQGELELDSEAKPGNPMKL